MANFIPSGNGASLGNLVKKLAVFEENTSLQNQLWQPKLQIFFEWFLVLKSLTPYTGVCRFFLSVILLPP